MPKGTAKERVEDPFFNIEETAAYLGQTERWVRRQLEEGKLPRTKMGRLVRLRKSHLDRYVNEHTTSPHEQ